MDLLGNLRKALSVRMKELRDKRGWDQHDLAAAVNMSASGIRGYEQEKRWPDPEELEKLAKALGVKSEIELLADPKALVASSEDSIIVRLIQILPALNKKQLIMLLDEAESHARVTRAKHRDE
jgi:transcriptional regulator with XRE-family HTH domain